MLLLIWALGILPAIAFFSWLKGRSDARFRDNIGITENPPWILGIMTAWLWPLQIAAGTMWMLYHVCYGAGSGTGLAVNEELHGLRKFAGDYQAEFKRTMQFLTDKQIDPANIDQQTTRALTARAIEFAMEEDVAMRRQEKGLALVKSNADHSPKSTRTPKVQEVFEDNLFEILDKNGYKVSDEYEARQPKGALEL